MHVVECGVVGQNDWCLVADQYIAMGNCHASLTGWCQQKPGYAEWLNTFDGSLFTRSWRGWKREGISKFHWCGKNTLAEGTSFMFYMNGLIFEVSVFNEKNDLSKKSRSPRLWFFEPCLSFPWCDAILLLRRLARLLKSFARMALPWRPQCERSHLFQVYWSRWVGMQLWYLNFKGAASWLQWHYVICKFLKLPFRTWFWHLLSLRTNSEYLSNVKKEAEVDQSPRVCLALPS